MAVTLAPLYPDDIVVYGPLLCGGLWTALSAVNVLGTAAFLIMVARTAALILTGTLARSLVTEINSQNFMIIMTDS